MIDETSVQALPISVEEHLDFAGHVHHKVEDLPNGAEVKLKFT